VPFNFEKRVEFPAKRQTHNTTGKREKGSHSVLRHFSQKGKFSKEGKKRRVEGKKRTPIGGRKEKKRVAAEGGRIS